MLGNGDGLNIVNLGMNSFTVNKGSDRKFVLNNILCVPQIVKNLLSMSQFTKDNSIYLEFHSEYNCVKHKILGQLLL